MPGVGSPRAASGRTASADAPTTACPLGHAGMKNPAGISRREGWKEVSGLDCQNRPTRHLMPGAPAARNLQHRDLAGDVAELNRAVLHPYANASSPRPIRYVFVPISTSAWPSTVSRRNVPV